MSLSPKEDPVFASRIKMILSVIIWGGSFIATKVAVQEFSPVSVVWLRFLIGTLCLLPIVYKRKMLKLSGWREAGEYALLGFLGITLHQWLQSNGLVTTQASTTAWIVASTPLFMVLLGWIFLKEKLNLVGVLGILLATFGVIMVVSEGDFASILQQGFGAPGDIYVLVSAPNWAVYSILLRNTLKKQPILKTTFFSILFGWIMNSVQFIFERGWEGFSTISTTSWVSVVYLGIFCTFLAYLFYYDALQNLTSTAVSAYLYIEPIATMIFAAVLIQEQITLASLAGGGLIIFGIWLVNRNQL